MRRAGVVAAVVCVCLISLGMGSMGPQDVIRIPDVQENYTVRLLDQSDVSVVLAKFSFEGQTYLMGKYGKAQISIGFDKIDSVIFLLQENTVKTSVRLKNGETVEIYIDRKKVFYGIAPFADVKIEIQDVKRITFGKTG